MNEVETWYVVKQANGQCAIVPADRLEDHQEVSDPKTDRWGPYTSQQDAIAHRVGLIRAGKCQPV